MSTDVRTLQNGYILSDYRIEGILGQGGFGITYLATDIKLNRQMAIKEYYPREFAVRQGSHTIRAAGNQEDQETFVWGLNRFLEEARILARFEHPNIIAVRRFFEKNGTAYLVMDYCNGKSLDEIIKSDRLLNSYEVDNILYPLLDGLEQIHNANFLHRDIKPANLFIRRDGSPVLLDFGAARHDVVGQSRTLTMLATRNYAAFEQYSTNGRQGPWTDIYGLGATLYRAVTGVKPQDSSDRMLEDTLEPAAKLAYGRFSASLLQAIDAAIAVRPENRPQNIAELRSLLLENSLASKANKALTQRQTSTTQTRVSISPEFKWSYKLKLLWGEYSAILNVLVGFLILGLALLIIQTINYQMEHGQDTNKLAEPSPLNLEMGKFSGDARNLEIQDCEDCPKMVRIPSGNFRMGSIGNGASRADEGPQHEVKISRFFYVGKFEVTLKEWEACVRDRSCDHQPKNEAWSGLKDSPVTDVSWIDALRYVDWLSGKTGKNYRLLSEAEWEYAARAESKTEYPFGVADLSNYAWFESNSKSQPNPVGEKLPNGFGLYDMHGNVFEWTQDCWNENYFNASSNATASLSGDCSKRVMRGGSWASKPEQLRSAARLSSAAADVRHSDLGFRVALTP
jgi:formylglycine-generating enzyme required for sulfatase activity